MKYEKKWLSYDQQADLLIDKCGLIADRASLIQCLQEVGYYRLSGYWYIFKRCNSKDCDNLADERFIEGTTFEEIWDLYTFDRQFKLTVLDAIERVEIYFRSQLAYLLAESTDVFGYLRSENLPRLDEEDYADFIRHCTGQYERSREPFALHFKRKYGDVDSMPPYWIMVNLMDFGTMLRLYKGAPVDVRNVLADQIGVSTRVLKSWLIALNTVRNICAHHGRLWNRGIGTRPIIPTRDKHPDWHEPFQVRSDNIFGVLTILSYLLEHIAPNTSWRNRLFELLETLSDEALQRMGFVEGWKECPIWQPWVQAYKEILMSDETGI